MDCVKNWKISGKTSGSWYLHQIHMCVLYHLVCHQYHISPRMKIILHASWIGENHVFVKDYFTSRHLFTLLKRNKQRLKSDLHVCQSPNHSVFSTVKTCVDIFSITAVRLCDRVEHSQNGQFRHVPLCSFVMNAYFLSELRLDTTETIINIQLVIHRSTTNEEMVTKVNHLKSCGQSLNMILLKLHMSVWSSPNAYHGLELLRIFGKYMEYTITDIKRLVVFYSTAPDATPDSKGDEVKR